MTNCSMVDALGQSDVLAPLRANVSADGGVLSDRLMDDHRLTVSLRR